MPGSRTITCGACGHVFLTGEVESSGEPRRPCAVCGSSTRSYAETLEEARLEFLDSLETEQNRPDYPGFLVNSFNRVKRSRLGRLAREQLTFDRRHPDKTVKIHHVEEQRDDGTWDTVHDERVEYPSKRRPES